MIMNKYFRFLTFHVKDAHSKTLLLQQRSTHIALLSCATATAIVVAAAAATVYK